MRRRWSFDIFDTVLTRAVGSPTAVFVLLGRRLSERGIVSRSAEAFSVERVRAEASARQARDGGEVTLVEIYQQLAQALGWDERQRDAAMLMEVELEEELIVPVPGAAQRVADAYKRGGGVSFLSDMYLPEEIINRLLHRHGLWREDDRLYVSNAAGACKASGGLFRTMLERESVNARDLTHCGNDRHSDVAMPRKIGVEVSPFFDCELNRFETVLESHAAETGGLASLLAGASRLTRLSVEARDERERSIVDVAGGVIAPVLTTFVLWILQQAEKQGLRRLYFISRDGQILLRIAEILAPKMGSTIELRYLHGSRQSWHLPSVTEIDASKLEWMCIKYDFLSARSVLARVGIDANEVDDVLAMAGFARESWDKSLDAQQSDRIKKLLGNELRDRILAGANERRAITVDYFRQHGLLDDERWAMVDIGWNGRLQASLGDMLATVGGAAQCGFYFALASQPSTPRGGTFHAFLYDPDHEQFRDRELDRTLATILEIGCAADHGSVEGYARSGDAVTPVLREAKNAAAQRWGLALMQQTILEYARRITLPRDISFDPLTARAACVELIRAFWDSPDPAEAAAWGSFPFESDQSGATAVSVAQPYSIGDVVRLTLGQRKPARASTWQQGSLAISSPVVRRAIQTGRRFKSLLRKFVGRSSEGRKAFDQCAF